MDITPKPRLLAMLGEIEFAEWQCIAELVDNAFDNFLELHRNGKAWAGGYQVFVTLPELADSIETAKVVVEDTGTGMSKAQLQDAVRAGFSSNDKYTKLGLFGMGFNVATARLGTKTTVMTTTQEESIWVGVEIDFGKLKDNFDAPEPSLPKEYMSAHGTRIEVTNLKADRLQYLRTQHSALRQILGKVYGYLLAEYPFELYVQGEKVNPVRHCAWDESRSVALKVEGIATKVPAQIQVDIPLSPVLLCLACEEQTVYLPEDPVAICSSCQSTDVKVMNRRIWGWLGVQRFLHQSNFGIDFLRNGRKILLNDRRLFEWRNLDDPASAPILEYPRNLAHQGGRLIGEIHLDHVPVTYAKDAFEYSDRGWRLMIEKLHGDGPVHPKKAKEFNYPENTSPIGLLIRAYDRTDAGTACLVPGDGKQAIHSSSRSWGEKFYEGDSAYQEDTVWWESAVEHDRKASAPAPAPNPSPENDVTDIDASDIWKDFEPELADEPNDPSSSEAEPEAPEPALTVEQRVVGLKESGSKITALCGEVHSPSTSQTAHLTCFEVKKRGKLSDNTGRNTAVWIQRGKGDEYLVFVDVEHSLVAKFGIEISQLVASELGRYLLTLSNKADTIAHSEVLAELIAKNSMFMDGIITPKRARELSQSLLEAIREQLLSRSQDMESKLLSALSLSDQEAIRDEMANRGSKLQNIDSIDALEFCPETTLLRLFDSVPEAFFDDRVFSRAYEAIGFDSRFKAKSQVIGMLADAVLMAGATNLAMYTTDQARRVALAVASLEESLIRTDNL